MAVSRAVRREILRDRLTCEDTSGETHEGILEVSHKDHTRNEHYEDPDNLTLKCTKHHLVEHIENEGNNGLPIEHNRGAIRLIIDRIIRLRNQEP